MHAPHVSATVTLQAMKSAEFLGARLSHASTMLMFLMMQRGLETAQSLLRRCVVVEMEVDCKEA